jgi:hypothetical protein
MTPLLKQPFAITETYVCCGHFVTVKQGKFIVSERWNKSRSIAIFDTSFQAMIFCNKDKHLN